jgi:hypothetical protein
MTITERQKLLDYIDSHQEETPEAELAALRKEAAYYGITYSEELLQDLKCVHGIDPIKEFIEIITEEVKEMRGKYGHRKR